MGQQNSPHLSSMSVENAQFEKGTSGQNMIFTLYSRSQTKQNQLFAKILPKSIFCAPLVEKWLIALPLQVKLPRFKVDILSEGGLYAIIKSHMASSDVVF